MPTSKASCRLRGLHAHEALTDAIHVHEAPVQDECAHISTLKKMYS